MRLVGLSLAGCLIAGVALAQDSGTNASTTSSSATMAKLISEGYEIKAAVPNGSQFVVFMQKETSAYACEFVSVTASRCRAIN